MKLTKVFTIEIDGKITFHGSLAGIYESYPAEAIGIVYKSLANYFSAQEKQAEAEDPLSAITKSYVYTNSKCRIIKGVLMPKFKRSTDAETFFKEIIDQRKKVQQNENNKRLDNLLPKRTTINKSKNVRGDGGEPSHI